MAAAAAAIVAVQGVAGAVPAGAVSTRTGAAVSWTTQAMSSPDYPSGWFFADSCPSASFCMAVGLYTDARYGEYPLTEAWNGSRWAIEPSAAGVDWLTSVSCVSATWCMAIGAGNRGEIWNGTRWSAVSMPTSSDSVLEAVACPSSSACVAVGSGQQGIGPSFAVAESWNGKAWSVDSAPRPGYTSSLAGVSCAAATACVAVGATTGTTGVEGPLAEAWNGKSWLVQPIPGAGGTSKGSWLAGVSCLSASFCVAAGGYTASAGETTGPAFSEFWNGSRWVVGPTTPGGALAAVSCSSTSDCVAVGGSSADSWNGKAWSATRTISEPYPVLYGVSCSRASGTPPATRCTTVGEFLYKTGDLITLAQGWNGSAWSLQAPYNYWDTGGTGNLAVSCGAALSCAAVATWDLHNPGFIGENWSGKAWSLGSAPGPRNSDNAVLSSVSCVSSTACTAVGTWFPSGPSEEPTPLALAWNGQSWTLEPTSGLSGYLTAVSCVASTSCMAVGTERDTSWPNSPAIADHWNGKTWSPMTLAQPAGVTYADLNAISCSSPTSCVAVGDGFSDVWNGSRWSTQTLPAPGGTTLPSLSAVSCTSATFCLAVGQSATDVADDPLVERWNGSAWSIVAQPTGGPVGVTLTGVSCASATACAAVGSSQGSSGSSLPLAENWNGTSWATTSPPMPAGAEDGSLDGVSCLTSGTCVAVGTYDTAASPGLPLATTATL